MRPWKSADRPEDESAAGEPSAAKPRGTLLVPTVPSDAGGDEASPAERAPATAPSEDDPLDWRPPGKGRFDWDPSEWGPLEHDDAAEEPATADRETGASKDVAAESSAADAPLPEGHGGVVTPAVEGGGSDSRSPEASGAGRPAAPVVPVVTRARRSRRSPLIRPAAIVALLVLLAAAGIVVGQSLRGGKEEPAPRTPPTTAAKPAKPTPPPKWGPLRAAPAGRLAVPLESSAVAAAGGRIVVLGGRSGGDARGAVLAGPPRGTVPRVAVLPAPLAAGAPLVRGDAVYLIGGERGDAVSDGIVRLDLGTNRVTFAGRFFEPLAGAGYVQAGDGLIIVGGWTGEILATGVLRYTLDAEPTLLTRLPEATRDPAVALRAGRVYVAGGTTAAGPTAKVYAIDLSAGTVTTIGELPRPVSGATMVVSGGQLYVLGGRSADGPVATVVRIDPRTGAIAPAGRMPTPLVGASAVRVGNATLVVGGTRGTAGTSAAIHRLPR
jgi:hypothetical protein